MAKKSSLGPLKKMAESIAEASSQEKIASLSRAFELFSHETERIEMAYNSLKEEFTAIHQELEQTNADLKKKIAELDVLTSYMRNIWSNISQGVLFIDLNGDITTFNTYAEKLFNIKESDILSQNFWKNFDDNAFGFSMRKALASKSAPPLSYTTMKNKGDKKELEVTANFVNDGSATPLKDDLIVRRMEGVLVVVRDITEIRALEIIASRSDRMKEIGEMAASVAHEIRNPLGGIKGFASLLLRDLENNPEKKRFAEYIIQGADTLNRLVTSILDYSRPIDFNREPLVLQQALKEVVESVKADSSLSKDVQFVLDMIPHDIKITGDKDHLKNAFLNLIVNASQAMEKGGVITISLKTDDDSIAILFKDTGSGISKEHLKKLFTPFFTTKAGGHGFGLAEVLKTVEAHGGDISVVSELGLGSTFTVKIPKFKR